METRPYYHTQQSCGKVMFLHLSVILFTGEGLPHPPGRHPPWADTPTPSGQTPPPPLGRHPPQADTPRAVHAGIRSTCGWYASYWNAFLFKSEIAFLVVILSIMLRETYSKTVQSTYKRYDDKKNKNAFQ